MLLNTATTQHRGRGRRNTAWCRGLHELVSALQAWFCHPLVHQLQGSINQQETPSLDNLEKSICYELSLARNDPG